MAVISKRTRHVQLIAGANRDRAKEVGQIESQLLMAEITENLRDFGT
jgi:hypothetical protein